MRANAFRIWAIGSFVAALAIGCGTTDAPESPASQNFTQWVNPMIGTSRMGHTYPVQLDIKAGRDGVLVAVRRHQGRVNRPVFLDEIQVCALAPQDQG
jgi:hypothetical protein